MVFAVENLSKVFSSQQQFIEELQNVQTFFCFQFQFNVSICLFFFLFLHWKVGAPATKGYVRHN